MFFSLRLEATALEYAMLPSRFSSFQILKSELIFFLSFLKYTYSSYSSLIEGAILGAELRIDFMVLSTSFLSDLLLLLET